MNPLLLGALIFGAASAAIALTAGLFPIASTRFWKAVHRGAMAGHDEWLADASRSGTPKPWTPPPEQLTEQARRMKRADS